MTGVSDTGAEVAALRSELHRAQAAIEGYRVKLAEARAALARLMSATAFADTIYAEPPQTGSQLPDFDKGGPSIHKWEVKAIQEARRAALAQGAADDR